MGYPEAIASLILVCPTEMQPSALRAVSPRLLVYTGHQGPPAASVRRAAEMLPEATTVTLRDDFGHPRADVVADHCAVGTKRA